MIKIILVDKKDNEIGVGEKLKVHQEGKLHRAFSIFIFNSKGEMLLQKRAKTKYHSPGLWTNTCCSHPGPNKNLEEEAKRRLKEEMRINCQLPFQHNQNLNRLDGQKKLKFSSAYPHSTKKSPLRRSCSNLGLVNF